MSDAMAPLSEQQLASFREDGFVLLPGFYDVDREIRPIQQAIYEIIGLCCRKYGVAGDRPEFSPEYFDAGYAELIAFDRGIGGEIYDAVKQIPGFQRLCACEANEALFRQLRGTELVGVAGGGSGIRIDNPGEVAYQAPWHQEYPAQLRSSDGLVYWSPLREVFPELGPVEICRGSHREGLAPVYYEDEEDFGRRGAYALRLANEEALVERYPRVAPLSKPGDLLIMDWYTIHRSGTNTSNCSRWTMQLRYFNFIDPEGVRIGWRGSFAAGIDFETILPGALVRKQDS